MSRESEDVYVCFERARARLRAQVHDADRSAHGQDGEMHGNGTLAYPDGKIYEGGELASV